VESQYIRSNDAKVESVPLNLKLIHRAILCLFEYASLAVMGAFYAVSDELRLVQSAISDAAADLGIGVSRAAGEVESLLGGGWSGTAASAFAAAWEQWRDGAAQLADALARCGSALAESAAGYDRADGESSAALNRILVRL
jgi:WXG100 family type VII secretion target